MRSSRPDTGDAHSALTTRSGDGHDDTEAGTQEGDRARLKTTATGGSEKLGPTPAPPGGLTAVTAHPDSTSSFDLNEGDIHCTQALTS